MKKKCLLLGIFILGSIVSLFFLLPEFFPKSPDRHWKLRPQSSYFLPIKIIESNSHDIPCLSLGIDDKFTTVKIDLGFSGGVSLPNEFLKELQNKSFFRSIAFQGMRGKNYKSDVYEIPEIKIGTVSLYHVKIEEGNSEFETDTVLAQEKKDHLIDYKGRVGWKLFKNLNIFLDCKHSILAFCDSLETLKEQGYPVDEFIVAPLLLDHDVIEFEGMTNSRPLRCMLDTGSTRNLLNKNLEGNSNDPMIFNFEDTPELLNFKISEKNFGAVKFHQMRIPFEIEAIIGMEFLESKLVFIDFSNRKIYFY